MRGVLALLLALWAVPALADTHAAASCSRADVATAVAAASDGDTVTIPAGSCTWTSGITVSGMGLTIVGSGTPTNAPTTTGASASCSATEITLAPASSMTAFTVSPSYGNSTSRISCMELVHGSGMTAGIVVTGTCASGGCPDIRWDNLTFTNWVARGSSPSVSWAINAAGNVFGVIDHNTISGVAGNYLQLVQFGLSAYKGVGAYGDNDWAQPENFGSADFLFLENNQFNTAGATENESQAVNGGGRLVARFNTFAAMDSVNFLVGWHGTESNGRPRSVHAFDVYGNTATCAAGLHCWQLLATRNGTGLAWGNTYSFAGAYLHALINLGLYRAEGGGSPWGACDGTSAWDTNDVGASWTGTIGSYVTGPGWGQYTITVSGTSPGWTTNQWSPTGSPYSIHDTLSNNGAEIQANGSNTLVIFASGGPSAYVPINGRTIEIRRATVCLDQAGRGAGYYYSANPPDSVAANQSLTPVYIWANTLTGPPTDGDVTPSSYRIRRNRDYYTEGLNQAAQTSSTSPFNGTTSLGMGHGTIALRPTTCTTGVGYWATDEGSWNTSGNGFGNGRLYLCTATNTWTLSYTPYTYPHPLVSGTTLPNAPTNVRIR